MFRTDDSEERQRAYYASNASTYEGNCHSAPNEHDRALAHTVRLALEYGTTSVLDTAAGTGKQLRVLLGRLLRLRLIGIEPVAELIGTDRASHALGSEELVQRDDLSLPFADELLDFVIETGVLHHIPEPHRAISEMLRVARLGVFRSDSNRLGQGSLVARLAKVGLCASGLWRAYYLARTRGRGFEQSEGDGVYYSFSIYDAMPMLTRWADRVWVVPTREPASRGTLDVWVGPLLNAPHGLVCAHKDDSYGNRGPSSRT